VSECAKNVIKGNVPMTGPQKANLRRRRKDVRALAIKKTSLTKKRRFDFLTQHILFEKSFWSSWNFRE